VKLEDKDLISIQEVRNLLCQAKIAQREISHFSQEKIDSICEAMAKAGEAASVRLAKMAQQETGFGIWQDKVTKNVFGSRMIYERYKDLKTVGILEEHPTDKVIDIAVPVGVVAGLIPSTNPTSSVFYKALIAVKAGNSIVFSPHPNALKAILEAVQVIQDAAIQAGAPSGLISCMTVPTLQGTQELMKNKNTNVILATGGGAMVHAAYSSGTPAIGVGPGNGPAFIEKSANAKQAVKHIIESQTFDNGTICASEQSIIVEEANKKEVKQELKAQGAYFMDSDEVAKLSKFILRANGTMNPQIVGKSVQVIAELADLNVPESTKVLIAPDTFENVGPKDPYAREKLAPILAYFEVANVATAEMLAQKLLENEGAGHTAMIHTENQAIAKHYALQVPASRILVNTPGAIGGIGATTNLTPALTLGCGAVGGSSTSDNVNPMNLLNLRRVAYGVRELSDIKATEPTQETNCDINTSNVATDKLVEELVKQVLAKLK
jgi:acetaldehyde dehydrogenase (acetylating)